MKFRAGQAYIADTNPNIVEHIEAMGAKAVIPSKCNRKQQREYDKDLYKKRNRIERCYSRLKQFRRLATCYDKNRICCQAFVRIACSTIPLRSIVDASSYVGKLRPLLNGSTIASSSQCGSGGIHA
jgi:putative transposase